MKARVLSLVVFLGVFIPCGAEASLELGTPSAIALNLENQRWSIGVGLNLRWYSVTVPNPSGVGLSDATLFVIAPAATARVFLSENQELQPFISFRGQREIPLVSADNSAIGTNLRDTNDSWQIGVGAGIRSHLSNRFAIGGETVALTRLQTFSGQQKQTTGSAAFLIFLQYDP